jgi:rhodanese-related sulfurtransferase
MKIPPSLLPVLLLSLVLNFAPRAIAEDAKKPAGLKATTTVNVTPDVAAQMMKEKAPVLVLDVRTPDEFAEGHIPGAMNVDFLGDDFEKKLAALPADRPLIVHCAAGNRSAKAVAKLAALQKFAQIFHLKSGFNGWKAAGKPVETKPAAK